tara:strand:- start:23702 stop:24202 length:501 start_codon:yes stop_codon:yes gene_type:complete
MDQVVVVNEKDEVVGTKPRDVAHRDGTPHRIVVIYVRNHKGEVLVQVRMSGRLDHSSAGHVDPGEEYVEAAKRELFEELGMEDVELTVIGDARSEEKIEEENQHRVHMMQIFSCIGSPGKLQEDEVRDVYWADPKELFEEMKQNPEDKKFTGGFRTSLPVLLESLI